MGPSGAGKTTLLNILAGRSVAGLSGEILINNSPRTKQAKKVTGYVMQRDIFFEDLSVYDTLRYTALLRLPSNIPYETKLSRVHQTLDELGLQKCKSTLIGGPRHRGISGGELKRLNVANELLSNPSLFILDEPTSGLDSSIAVSLIKTLSELSSTSNRTVIMSIHQPSSHMFAMFDALILLTNGHVVYQGPGKFAYEYFASLGFPCPTGFNTADYLMDIVSDPALEPIFVNAYAERLRVSYDREYYVSVPSMRVETPLQVVVDGEAQEVTVQILRDEEGPVITMNDETAKTDKNHYYYQIWVLMQRGFRKDLRGVFTWISILETTLVAVICGILWFQTMNKFEESRLKNNTGLIFFTVTHWGFYPMFVSLGSFPEESLVIAKERSSKTYGVSAYFIAKTLSEIPVHLFNPSIYLLIIYFLTGFPITVIDFLGDFWILLLSVVVAQSIGVFISAVSPTFQKGASTLTVFMLTTMLAAGFYVSPIPAWISWLKWLSYLQFSYGAFMQIYFITGEREFICSSSDCDVMTGKEALESIGTFLPFWANILCLHAIFILSRVCTYIVLRYGKRLTLSN